MGIFILYLYWVYRAGETGSQKWLWEEEKGKDGRTPIYEYSTSTSTRTRSTYYVICIEQLLQRTWLYLFVTGHLLIIVPLVMEVPRHRIWRSRGAS